METGGLTAPEPASKDSLKNDESTKNCTVVHNPKEIVKFASMRDEELREISRKSNVSHIRKYKHSRKTIKMVFKTVVEYPVQNSITKKTKVKQPLDDPSGAPGEHMLFHYPNEPSLQVPRPTPKKIGLMGMGVIAERIVNHFLNLGLDVSVWNQNAEKCQKLVEAGAQLRPTPSAVVRNSDIIFNCVSGLDPVLSLVFECVLQGFEKCEAGTKGYVDLTFNDPSISRVIAEAIYFYGGKYLEAPIYDSKRLAENRGLRIICSGDVELFRECESWFRAFSNYVSFSNLNIGANNDFILAVNKLMDKEIDKEVLEAFSRYTPEYMLEKMHEVSLN
ncbi:oxidoreductase GLYR1-like protein [Trichonephila clavata]|uniref:Oxidoreductase GLYR1-like protein n=1 Tax=Trichonephila clavata TaxID=2740835 RepID=A0A8X6L3A7_TRICU|nr:oxidoreductase GLYR1-like protein [Trichonephila clavata]